MIAAGTLIPYALFAIAVVGTAARRPGVSERVRAFTAFVAVCAIVGGAAGAFGAIC